MSDLLQRLQSSLAGRYAVERELGRGGMATVFLARDVKHGREVAIKVLSSDVSVALGVERFQREIEIASALTHPHIVPLYDSGEADGCLFYAMPYITGESLRARLDREKQLPLDDAIRITCEVASALDYAHRKGVLHRDVKPANILLEDGHAVIADFGIARAISRAAETDKMTMTGVTLGTPTYMSPEQASGEHALDGRSDIYSLACVLYEMLIGQPPFTGPNAQAVMARHAMETVPSLRIVRGTIPEEVEDAILCALSKAPADRFATAQQFADALTGGGTGMTMRFTTSRAAARARQHRKRVRVAAVAGAAGVLLFASGAGAWWLTRADDVPAVELDRSRIAVLYFTDRSPQRDLDHIADGLTESLIDRLGAVDGLTVISSNGVEPYRGQRDIPPVASALGVGTIVIGQVDHVGDSLLATVEVLDGPSGARHAGNSLRWPAADLLAARDSLAERVAFLLRQSVGDGVRLQQAKADASTPESWILVQRADRLRREAEALAEADSVLAAAEQFRRADSLLALAESIDRSWAGPAVARGELLWRQSESERDPLRLARLLDSAIAHATRAVRIDSRSADAWALLGWLRLFKVETGFATSPAEQSLLLTQAAADLDSAVRLDRRHAEAWNALSVLRYRQYNKLGSNRAAYEAYKADAYLESAPAILWRLFATSYDIKQTVEARNWCAEGRHRYPADPRFVRCQLWMLTLESVEEIDLDAGWRLSARLDSLAPPSARDRLRRESAMIVAAVLGRLAKHDSAQGRLEIARARRDSAFHLVERAHADRDVDPHGDLIGFEAAARTMIGDTDGAIDLIERFLTANPVHREGFARNETWWWEPLQDDPRFKALVGSGG